MQPGNTNRTVNETTGQVRSFLESCARSMILCAANETQTEMATRLLETISTAQPRPFEARSIGALRNLQWIKDMKLARNFQQFAHQLPWSSSPRTLDDGERVGLCDFGHMFKMPKIRAGLMLVDAAQTYPEHNHPPHEMYFLISGTAQWRYGGNAHYETISAGNILYNHPWNIHGVRAGHTPSLSLYLLTPLPGEEFLGRVYPRSLAGDEETR